jgi:hypothetical protein
MMVDNDKDASRADKVAHLKMMLVDPGKQHITDILRRRLFAIEHEITFTNPFNEVDETLYRIGGRQ